MLEPPDHLVVPEAPLGALLWRLPVGSNALSSAVVGGGWPQPRWILNVRVERDYARTDLDDHIQAVANAAGLDGRGIGLLTAADITHYGVGQERGLRVEATAGVSDPTWAAAPEQLEGQTGPGTVNLVVRLPVALGAAAAVNAIATITEAKTQAFFEYGIPGTGTATDAVTLVWPPTEDSPVQFCGPRARWGAAMARATRDAVAAAIDRTGVDG